MKTLFCVGLVLLLAVPVGAEGNVLTGAMPLGKSVADEPIQQTNCEYDKLKHWWICEDVPTDAPCLAKMEAAMRAMEPYFDRLIYNEDGSISMLLTGQIHVPYFSTDHNDPRMKQFWKERAEQHKKVIEQWTAAKRACWRTP